MDRQGKKLENIHLTDIKTSLAKYIKQSRDNRKHVTFSFGFFFLIHLYVHIHLLSHSQSFKRMHIYTAVTMDYVPPVFPYLLL